MQENLTPAGSIYAKSCDQFEVFNHFVVGRLYNFIKDSFWRLIPRTADKAPRRTLDTYFIENAMGLEELKTIFEKSKKPPIPISQIHYLVAAQAQINPNGSLTEDNHSNLFFCLGAKAKIILLCISRQGKKGWSVFPVDYFGGKLTIRRGAKMFL